MNLILTNTHNAITPAVGNSDAAKASEWLAGLSVKTDSVKTYARALADFFKFLGMQGLTLAMVTRPVVIDYLNNALAGKSDATRALRLQTVKGFFDFLVADYGYAKNPAFGVKVKTNKQGFKKEFLTIEQGRALLDAKSGDSIQDKRDRALMALMLTTGARVGEVQSADVGDLLTIAGEQCLKIKGKGHNEKDAFLKITPAVAALLASYLDARGESPTNTNSPLFQSHSPRTKGERISRRAISFIVKSTMRGQGIDSPLFTAHSLRHTAAVTALENGATLADAQIFLRHTSPTITMRYTHGLEARKNNCAAKVSNAFFN